MNNSINATNPSFGAKVNVKDLKGVVKDTRKVVAELEKATEKYPKDYLDISSNGKDKLKVYLTPEEGMERTIEFTDNLFEELVQDSKKSVDSFIERMKICFDTLKYGAKRDVEMDKCVTKLINKGHIEEDGNAMDSILNESWKNTKEKMYKKLSATKDEVLSTATIID